MMKTDAPSSESTDAPMKKLGAHTNGFARGFANALNIFGLGGDREFYHEYNGRDLSKTTVQEALNSDWESLVGVVYEVDADDALNERGSESPIPHRR